MRDLRRGALAALAAAIGLLGPAASQARPFTVNDLLRQESFGRQAFDPSGRWWVTERRDAYDTAPRFNLGLQEGVTRSRLLVADLRRPSAARPLLRGNPRGVVMAGFSPSGARLAVFQLRGARWRLGVVTLRNGAVRWFPVTPELSDFGRTLQWRSDRELLIISRADGAVPWVLEEGHASADRLPALWAAAAGGGGRPSIAGSGRFVTERPRPRAHRLLQVDVLSGRMDVLSTGAFTDLEIAPGGEHVALLEAGEDLQPRSGQPAQGSWGIGVHRSQLSILSMSARTRRLACQGCDVLPLLLAWSPRGESLLVFTRRYPGPWTDGRLLRVDCQGQGAAVLGPELRVEVELRPEVVHAGWMGDDPVVLARPAATSSGRADYYRLGAAGQVNLTRQIPVPSHELLTLSADTLTMVVDGALWRADSTGAATQVSWGRFAPVPHSGPVDARTALVPPPEAWVTSAAHGALLKINDAGGLTPGPHLKTLGRLAAMAAEASAATVSTLSATGVESIALLRPGLPDLQLSQVNAALSNVEPPLVIPILHVGPKGQPLTSWLYLPSILEGAPPPLVVRAYSGDVYTATPRGLSGAGGLMTDVRTLVGHGYAVLLPSLPRAQGSTEPMADLAAHILAVVDAAAATPSVQGRFNPTRLALWGHSYGGYTVMAAIGQTDRFKAAVSISGVSDLLSKWSSLPVARRVAPDQGSWSNWSTGNTESGQNAMGAPPWSAPDRYLRNSPLLFADRIHTPLLLIHGDQDLIPLAQSEAMFSALYRQDKDAELLTYWGEGHYISSPAHVRDAFARAFRFLDRNLGPARAAAARPQSPGPASANDGPRPRLSPPTESPTPVAPR